MGSRWIGLLLWTVWMVLAPVGFGQTLNNGSFSTGSLAGWTANTVDGGQVSLVKQGTVFSVNPGSDKIPFPHGAGAFAALLRATASPQSVGILTSDPFVPRSSKLAFYTLSESSAVAPKVVILTPRANLINPSVSEILHIENVVCDSPGTGATAVFQRQVVDLSAEFAAKQAVRVQFRQPATASGAGFFTLITLVDDTGQSPVIIAPSPRSLGIVNGNFATGDLTGWAATGIKGGYVLLVQNGSPFPGNYENDPIPFPDGGKSWAVNVRSSDSGAVDSVGILVSDPFIPNAPVLSFKTHSQNARVSPQILLLKTSADPINPRPEDVLLTANVVNRFPGEGGRYTFEDQSIDLSAFYNASDPTQGTPMRLHVRQHTTQSGYGWYTLFTNFYAGPVAPLPPFKGDLNFDGQINVGDAIIGLRVAAGLVSPVPPVLVQVGDVAPKRPDGEVLPNFWSTRSESPTFY
ncbi:MAG: hypothetical protein KY468_05570, partial [Armatimonadetes bacterium]|nr:hypothetical protein [Armatimonadota bacterium]